jgi:hypothetical protein
MITKEEQLIEISQGVISISAFSNTTRVGITLSGGADSAMLLYLLTKFKIERRPDLQIFPITIVNSEKAYQEIFAKKVIEYVENKLAIKLNDDQTHLVKLIDGAKDYVFTKAIWSNKLKSYNKLQETYMGETMNPPEELDSEWVFRGPGREPSRNGKQDLTQYVRNHRPFRNINKQGVKELYEMYGIVDELFPLTRSCEHITRRFDSHCGFCWFCAEREWGFSRLI